LVFVILLIPMRNTYLAVFVFIIVVGCNDSVNGPKQEEYEKLQSELNECKKTVEDLSNTPSMRLANGQKYQTSKDFANAKKEFQELILKFPGTDEAKKATIFISEIEKLELEFKLAEERKKLIGFKGIKEENILKIGDLSINFKSISSGGQWIFDNYGSEWRYRSSERGETFILSKVTISAESKNPKLPPILVYKMQNGVLNLIGTMNYEFSRWKDYGSFLGNYADYGNDFAHSKTISFSCGLAISKTDLDNEAVFVVVRKTNCFSRSESRFGNPPVSYIDIECNAKSILTVDDFDDDYQLVKVFNKNKL
jgi:hypothetical protein